MKTRGGVTIVDKEVRQLFKRMMDETTGKKRNPFIEKFMKYKKGRLRDPWYTQSVTDADGVRTRWPDLSDDYARKKFEKKKGSIKFADAARRGTWVKRDGKWQQISEVKLVFYSPKGKKIQAPWNYETGCMMKIPTSMKDITPSGKRREKMLFETGALRESIRVRKSVKPGKHEFVVGVYGARGVKDYAYANFYGAPHRRSRSGSPNKLPARPFMEWTAKDLNELVKMLYRWAESVSR